MKLQHLIPSCLLFYCFAPLTAPAFAADHLTPLNQRLSEGDRLLAAGKPVEAIRTWRSIWDLDAVDVEGLGKQLSTVDKYVDAYETMGPEGLEVATDYLEVIVGMSVEERQPALYVRLGDILWKGGRQAEAAAAYQRALNLQPARPDAAQLKERIRSAPAASKKRDVTGTVVSAPRAVPAECIDPPPSRRYPLDGGRSLCVAFNEFGNEPGCWAPRESLGGPPNLTIQLEGSPAEPRGKDALPITVYLNDGKTWRRVLGVRGYGFRFVGAAGRELPDLEIQWDPREKAPEEMARVIGEKRRQRTVFAWNGKRYGNGELAAAQRQNGKALALHGKKNYKGALAAWREALKQAMSPGSGLPVDAEILNNYGFALFRQSPQEAETFLGFALQVDPARWQAHLNLGDLLWDQGHFDRAIESYRAVLRFNPSYRRAQILQDRITRKEQAIANLKEERATTIEARDQNYLPCEGVFFISAAEYARKTGLDPDRIAAALNLKARDFVDDGRDSFETSGFSSNRYHSHCTSFALRVVEIMGFSTSRGRFIAVLYWGGAPGQEDSLWRLAVLRRDDYGIDKVVPLYESAGQPVEETSYVETDLGIDSGRLIATVTGRERGNPSTVRQLIVQPAADGSFEVVSSKSWYEGEE